ncbi:MAG: hypothetical protein ACREV5_09500 [Steroidobacter sp.]
MLTSLRALRSNGAALSGPTAADSSLNASMIPSMLYRPVAEDTLVPGSLADM